MFGIGPMEILVVILLAGLMLAPVVGAIVIVYLLMRKRSGKD